MARGPDAHDAPDAVRAAHDRPVVAQRAHEAITIGMSTYRGKNVIGHPRVALRRRQTEANDERHYRRTETFADTSEGACPSCSHGARAELDRHR
jgi:hypothetical protein